MEVMTTKTKRLKSEKIELKLHRRMIRLTIERQAGELSDAICEGIMNSIDAGCTELEVEITPSQVRIVDNGAGMDEQTIRNRFATLGQPPEEDQTKTYGEFCVGRGQMFAFGVNTWRTRDNVIIVDIRDSDEDQPAFLLEHSKVKVNGTVVEIELYEPLKSLDLFDLVDELRRDLKYLPIAVKINDEVVGGDLDKRTWDQVTDTAYYKFDSNSYSGIELYNYGLAVGTQRLPDMVGKVIAISKKAMRLNVARNQPLSDCEVWQKIKKEVPRKPKGDKPPELTKCDVLRGYAYRLMRGDIPREDLALLWHASTVTAVNGKKFSLKDIEMKFRYVVQIGDSAADAAFGDAVMQRLPQVLVAKRQDGWNCIASGTTQIISAIGKVHSALYSHTFASELKPQSLEYYRKTLNMTKKVVDRKQWNIHEKRWMELISTMQCAVRKSAYFSKLTDRVRWLYRNLFVGDSEGTAQAWTDGQTTITFDRAFLKSQTMTLLGIGNVASVLIHELTHDSSTEDTHLHTPEFYNSFHELVLACHGAAVNAGYARLLSPQFAKKHGALKSVAREAAKSKR